jgi:hypothetical protein
MRQKYKVKVKVEEEDKREGKAVDKRGVKVEEKVKEEVPRDHCHKQHQHLPNKVDKRKRVKDMGGAERDEAKRKPKAKAASSTEALRAMGVTVREALMKDSLQLWDAMSPYFATKAKWADMALAWNRVAQGGDYVARSFKVPLRDRNNLKKQPQLHGKPSMQGERAEGSRRRVACGTVRRR